MYKEVLFDLEARQKILKGVKTVAKAVVSTLGPRGQNVIFEESSYPTVTKDGVTVAQQVILEDKFENLGVMLARECAENTNRVAGDGTTTTIVLLDEILTEGNKAVASGMNPILLKRGMDRASEVIIEELEKTSKKIKTKTEKEQIATISANNDISTGKMITSVLEKVGTDGIVTVTSSNSLKTEVEYIKGTKLNSGYEAHNFINDSKRLVHVSDEPAIIITTEEITMHTQIIPIIQSLLNNGQQKMILFAEKIEGNALGFLVTNALQGKFVCVPVKIPSFGGYQRDLVDDLATLTETTVLGKDCAFKLEEGTFEHCGTAERVIVGRDETIVSGGKGSIKKRLIEAKTLLKESDDLYAKEKLKERIGRLTGSIANIKVGGATETEQEELKYRVEDALNATKHAVKEGVVEGGGMALLRIFKNRTVGLLDNREHDEGIKIVFNALKAPLREIANNSGVSGEAVVSKCLDGTIGYNALNGKYEDLFLTGVIDPVKVVKSEIQNAVSTAGILLTSNTAITIKPKKDD